MVFFYYSNFGICILFTLKWVNQLILIIKNENNQQFSNKLMIFLVVCWRTKSRCVQAALAWFLSYLSNASDKYDKYESYAILNKENISARTFTNLKLLYIDKEHGRCIDSKHFFNVNVTCIYKIKKLKHFINKVLDEYCWWKAWMQSLSWRHTRLFDSDCRVWTLFFC